MEEAFYNISMYLYNKNILEYAQIARNETESKIPYIEGCSSIYICRPFFPKVKFCHCCIQHTVLQDGQFAALKSIPNNLE